MRWPQGHMFCARPAPKSSRLVAVPSSRACRTAVQYDSFLTETSKARRPSPIRALQPIAAIPGMISLGAGNPNPEGFPFETATFTLKGGGNVEIDSTLMRKALQYGPTPGMPELVAWAKDLQQKEHSPPRPQKSWDLAFTTGSQDAISKTCDMLFNRGDSVLVEEPCYPGALAIMQPKGLRINGLPTDGQGLIPESLEDTLLHWESRRPNWPKPRVLYTIPTGHNPSGATIPEDRRHKIYSIARRFDLLIMEDDPYYFLQLEGRCCDHGVYKTPSSFLSLDEDGRVIRFDSMSKVLSSGFRVGFATGPTELIERLVLHMQTGALCTSGISQACVHALLTEWGESGWATHVRSVQALYRIRRDFFISCAEKHLDGLAEWTKPEAGMFVWMRLNGIKDSKALIEGPAREEKVLLVPGQYFSSTPSELSSWVRASYSTATSDEVDEALRRLALLLKKNARTNVTE